MRQDLFNHTINQLRYGFAADELSEHLNDCVQRSKETNKMSTLTLTLKIKPKADGKQIFIEDQIKTNLPQFAQDETILFTTDEGDLSRTDPRQKSMPGLIDANQTETPKQIKTA